MKDAPDEPEKDSNAKRKEASDKVAAQMKKQLEVAKEGWLKVAETSDLVEREAKLETAVPTGRFRGRKRDQDQDQDRGRGNPAHRPGDAMALGLRGEGLCCSGFSLVLVDQRKNFRSWLRSRGTRTLVLLLVFLPWLAPGCSPKEDGEAAQKEARTRSAEPGDETSLSKTQVVGQ